VVKCVFFVHEVAPPWSNLGAKYAARAADDTVHAPDLLAYLDVQRAAVWGREVPRERWHRATRRAQHGGVGSGRPSERKSANDERRTRGHRQERRL
jgi:hypothetical protein